MADVEVRELVRALRASPRDGALALRLLQALRRAGAVAPPSDELEPAPNPDFVEGDLALVARRSRPREAFLWLPEMDACLGTVARIARLERDGLGALLEGPSLRPPRWPGDPMVGRSFGFASLYRLSSP